MIAIVDYGVGNLYSLQSSLRALQLETVVTSDAPVLEQAGKIILPGVGAFGDAMAKLTQTGLADAVKKQAGAGKPLLGICLGMQLLFDISYEFGTHKGLGLVPGEIGPLAEDLANSGYGSYKVPHIGWNLLQLAKPQSPLLKYTQEGDSVYYVHSYYAKNCGRYTIATSEYGIDVTGAVQNNNVFGTQFHPEKSGDVGLAMLRAFGEV